MAGITRMTGMIMMTRMSGLTETTDLDDKNN